MRRTKAERRHNDWKKIHKKANIIKHVFVDGEEWFEGFWEHQQHRLSKEKIHCSCPICSEKTKDRGYKASDFRKLEALQSSVDESEMNLKILPRRKEW